MRSLFGTLKARRVVFANPAASLTGRRIQPPPVLPLDDPTANPHLLVNQSTAGGTGPVSRSYIQGAVRQLGITVQNLRADRFHSEAQATSGDPLQRTHLFGISDPTAIRYRAEIGIPVRPGR
jgi:hypothetical protein